MTNLSNNDLILQGDADSGVDRLWQKKKVEAKQI